MFVYNKIFRVWLFLFTQLKSIHKQQYKMIFFIYTIEILKKLHNKIFRHWVFWCVIFMCHISRLHHTTRHRLFSASRRSRRTKQMPYHPTLHQMFFQQYEYNKGNPWICNWTCPSNINHDILVYVMFIWHCTVNVPRSMFDGR